MAHHPASACRPTSVIVSQVTVIGRPQACTVLRGPWRRRCKTVQHQAAQGLDREALRQHDLASVHPSGEPASSGRARLGAGAAFRSLTAAAQALARRPGP
jgi:hypothetical protein